MVWDYFSYNWLFVKESISPLYIRIRWYFGLPGKQTQRSIWDHLLAVPLLFDIQCLKVFFWSSFISMHTRRGVTHYLWLWSPHWISNMTKHETGYGKYKNNCYIYYQLADMPHLDWTVGKTWQCCVGIEVHIKRIYVFNYHDLHIWSKNCRFLQVILQTPVP